MVGENDPHTIAYRVGEAERLLRELRAELHEQIAETRVAGDAVNRELRTMIKDQYLTVERAHNEFVGRGEPERRAEGRREWLLVLAAGLAGIAATVQVVVLVVGGR